MQKEWVKVIWAFDEKETELKFSEGWEDMYRIAKLDHLQDAIAMLQEKYHQELTRYCG